MIEAIINSYLSLFLTVGIGAILLFIFGAIIILKLFSSTKPAPVVATTSAFTFHPQDLSAIAGDDLMATQLDLARAYIETDKKELAKMILRQVVSSGSALQQKEAQRLLDFV